MRQALIEGLDCDHADPVRINGIVGAFLLCRTDGKAATHAALTALRKAGFVVWDSKTKLASKAPAKLKAHHFVRPGTMWEPRINDKGVEVPQDHDSQTFVVVVRDVQVFHAHHHRARRSIIWAAGDLRAWAAALGDLVIKHSPVLAEDYVGTVADEYKPPRARPRLDLDAKP